MKIAPKPKPGQEVSLDKLLTGKPAQVDRPQNAAHEEEDAELGPPGAFSAELCDGYLLVHNLPIPKYGKFTYRCLAITTTPAYVNNLEEYDHLVKSAALSAFKGQSWSSNVQEKVRQMRGKTLLEKFTPASALTLYAYAFNRWVDQLNHGPSAMPPLFEDKIWKEGILVNSGIIPQGKGQPDKVEHSDLEAITSILPGPLLEVLLAFEDNYLDSRLARSADYVRSILSDYNNSPSPIPGFGFGFAPRLNVFSSEARKNGALMRIESAIEPKKNSCGGYVYGVRAVTGCTK